MAKKRSRGQKRAAKLKQRERKSRPSQPRPSEPKSAPGSGLSNEHEAEIRKVVRDKLDQGTPNEEIIKVINQMAADIVDDMWQKSPAMALTFMGPDKSAAVEHIVGKLDKILTEETALWAVDEQYPTLKEHFPELREKARKITQDGILRGASPQATMDKIEATLKADMNKADNGAWPLVTQLEEQPALTSDERKKIEKDLRARLWKMEPDEIGRFLTRAKRHSSPELFAKIEAGAKEVASSKVDIHDILVNPDDKTKAYFAEKAHKLGIEAIPMKIRSEDGKLMPPVGPDSPAFKRRFDELVSRLTDAERTELLERGLKSVSEKGVFDVSAVVETLQAERDGVVTFTRPDVQSQEWDELEASLLAGGVDPELPFRIEVPTLNTDGGVQFVEAGSAEFESGMKQLMGSLNDEQKLAAGQQIKAQIEAYHAGTRTEPININEAVAASGFVLTNPSAASVYTWEPQSNQLTQSRDKPEEETVDAYMDCLEKAFQLTRVRGESPAAMREARYNWTCLRDARVFHISDHTFNGVYREADRFTTEEIAGFTYHGPDEDPANISDEEKTAHSVALIRESRHVVYPEKFPFPTVFLGYGKGFNLPYHRLIGKTPHALQDKIVEGLVRGHIMTTDGYCAEVIVAVCQDEKGQWPVSWINPLRFSEYGWPRTKELEPWVLPVLINIINEHRTFIMEMSTQQRRQYKKNRKKMGLKGKGHTPPPYYTLKLKSKVLKEQVRKTHPIPRGPLTYKTDVRGHERCRVRRGPLPIDPELAAKLKKREYKLFTTNGLDVDTFQKLSQRGMGFKRSDEWLAILTSWIDDRLNSNDPDIPYIPAVRKLGDVRTKRPKPTGSWADDPAR